MTKLTKEQEDAKSHAHYLAGRVGGAARKIHEALLEEEFALAVREFQELEIDISRLRDHLSKLPK
jgi:hypothetical protein